MDNKMTDKEIKKALGCCKDGGNRCDECPYGIDDCLTDNDESILLKDALDLINRKDIKIAELTVVLCKNCEFVHFNVESCIYHCKRRGYFSEEVESTDFCSNGKEKTTR